jgi:hypothetical protein
LAFLDSGTAVIDAILTTKGRELLAKNDGSFRITKFAFGDDEINYQLFDAANSTSPDTDILNLPVLEPTSNEDVALRFRLVTLPKGSLKISTLTLIPTNATANFGDSVPVKVSTTNGEDGQGYTAISRDTDIARLDQPLLQPNENGEVLFTLLTGANAAGKSGVVVIDFIGVNTGARSELELTISASGL